MTQIEALEPSVALFQIRSMYGDASANMRPTLSNWNNGRTRVSTNIAQEAWRTVGANEFCCDIKLCSGFERLWPRKRFELVATTARL